MSLVLDSFLCPVCLEVFCDPVSTPCGHSFCKRCISETWDSHCPCSCPLCKEVFRSRPQLKTNTFISEMVSILKEESQPVVLCEESQPVVLCEESQPVVLCEESQPVVLCDMCPEPQQKALKSCLLCLSSFCEAHLQPHFTLSGLKRHPLMEPVEDLEDRVCAKHQRPLELFCGTDQSCVCTMCVLLEHKNHELVSLEEGCERRRCSVLQVEAQSQELVQQKRQEVHQTRSSLDISQREALRESSHMVQSFSAVVDTAQQCLNRHTAAIQLVQKKNQSQAEAIIQQLQKEICELQQRSTEAQRFTRTEDPLVFLQRCPDPRPPAESCRESFEAQSCEGTVGRALMELESCLSEHFRRLASESSREDFRRLRRFSVDLSLDPDTAHPQLVLSKDQKQVHYSAVKTKAKDSPLRFQYFVNVMTKQSFSSGKFYFEVQVKGKTDWDVGVALETINRKEKISASPKHGQWTMWLRNGSEYAALSSPSTPLLLQTPPQKLAVFVDYGLVYGQGLVSFYDADSSDLLYSFTDCCFRGGLLPVLSPCLNDRGTNFAPLVLTTVQRL